MTRKKKSDPQNNVAPIFYVRTIAELCQCLHGESHTIIILERHLLVCLYLEKIQCRQQQLINGNCRLDNFCVCFGIFAAAIMVPCRRRPVARIPILMSVYTIHMYLSGSGERERADGQLDGRREERYSVTINPSCNTLPLGFIFSGRDLLR